LQWWLHTLRLRTITVCDFSISSVESAAPARKIEAKTHEVLYLPREMNAKA